MNPQEDTYAERHAQDVEPDAVESGTHHQTRAREDVSVE